jgi:tellurite resistance protein
MKLDDSFSSLFLHIVIFIFLDLYTVEQSFIFIFRIVFNPMAVSKEEMTDSEIIQLLAEYNFTDKEISKILKEIKNRDFEAVLAFIEEIRTSQGQWQDNDREKMLEEMRKRQDIQRMEEERRNKYKELLKGKIEANREEQKLREEQENKTLKISEPVIRVDGDIKIRILNGSEEIYIGFDSSATLEDIYNKVAEKIGTTTFELVKFGLGEKVSMSKTRVYDQFRAKAVMLEIKHLK